MKTPAPSRILSVCPGGIGDTVLFSPVLRALHRAWPESKVTLLCSLPTVQELYGSATELEAIEIADTNRPGLLRKTTSLLPFIRAARRAGSFDSAVFAVGVNPGLRHFLRTALGIPRIFHAAAGKDGITDLERNLETARPFDPKVSRDDAFVPVTEAVRHQADAWLAGQHLPSNRPLLALYPSVPRPNRPRWPLERMLHVARQIHSEFNLQPVVIGGPAEQLEWRKNATEQPDFPCAAGALSLSATAALLERCALALCNDGGLMHIAGALQIPTVCVMPNAPSSYHPPGRRTVMIPSAFRPVLYPSPIEPDLWNHCAEAVDSEAVLAACRRVLQSV